MKLYVGKRLVTIIASSYSDNSVRLLLNTDNGPIDDLTTDIVSFDRERYEILVKGKYSELLVDYPENFVDTGKRFSNGHEEAQVWKFYP